jgi:hypothetical protein
MPLNLCPYRSVQSARCRLMCHAMPFASVFLIRPFNGLCMSNKSKTVPLHAMEANGVRGGVAPTHT